MAKVRQSRSLSRPPMKNRKRLHRRLWSRRFRPPAEASTARSGAAPTSRELSLAAIAGGESIPEGVRLICREPSAEPRRGRQRDPWPAAWPKSAGGRNRPKEILQTASAPLGRHRPCEPRQQGFDRGRCGGRKPSSAGRRKDACVPSNRRDGPTVDSSSRSKTLPWREQTNRPGLLPEPWRHLLLGGRGPNDDGRR